MTQLSKSSPLSSPSPSDQVQQFVWSALVSQVTIVLAELRGAPLQAHLSDILMLVLVGGRERTASEYSGLLRATGWEVEKVCATGTPFTVLLAAAVLTHPAGSASSAGLPSPGPTGSAGCHPPRD